MDKLIVSLPAVRRSIRNIKRSKTEQNKTTSSKERVRKFRENLKNDSTKLEKMKLKKKEENRRYKERMRHERMTDPALDEKMKAKQNEWKRKSRKRQAGREKRENQQEPKRSTGKQRKLNSIRKTAERVRRSLPESPRAWASTIKHIVKNATPKRLSHLQDKQTDGTNESHNVEETLDLNRVGRPTAENSNVKRKLAFSSRKQHLAGKKKWQLSRYKRRKEAQHDRKMTKPQAYKAAWKDRLTNFLETNSRVMPNKKDTVLINGNPVPKRHLLCSKLKLFRKFKKQYQRKHDAKKLQMSQPFMSQSMCLHERLQFRSADKCTEQGSPEKLTD